MKHGVLAVVWMLVVAMAQAEPEIKGPASELGQFLSNIPKTVTITGQAEVRAPASRAVLILAVVSETKSLREALQANTDVRGKVMAQLKQQGIPLDRIQSSKFSSTPKFGIFSEKAKSYRVENVMRIAVQDEKEFHTAAAAVDAWPEVQYGGVEFEYADKETLKAKALAQACDNAGERKKLYEERLGLKLSPSRFAEGTVTEQETKPVTRESRGGRFSSLSAEYSSAVQEAYSSFGEFVCTTKVVVEYTIQPK